MNGAFIAWHEAVTPRILSDAFVKVPRSMAETRGMVCFPRILAD